MGLQEGGRALAIARVLNDSLCLATAYNVTGVFLMNSDQLPQSISYFNQGIKYCRQPPYGSRYLVVSKPHNLFGNLGEAYYKLGYLDSALKCEQHSLSLASQIPSYRGIAVALNLMGLIAAKNNYPEQAISQQMAAATTSLGNGHPDVALVSYSALAGCYKAMGKTDSMLSYIAKGFSLLKQEKYINAFFKNQFLDEAIGLLKNTPHDELLKLALTEKASLTTLQLSRYDAQITLLLKANLANETRAARVELMEAQRQQSQTNTRLIIALILLVSVTILFFVNRYYHRRQLKEIEIRNRISRDLHDDIGATLSSIQLYSELASNVHDTKPVESKDILNRINIQSRDIMARMGDVIWSLKPADDTSNSITDKLKNYCTDLLAVAGINCVFKVEESLNRDLKNPILRKNILLIAKEALNNVAKYSKAANCKLILERSGQHLLLQINDDGLGLDTVNTMAGNGLLNMKKRCEELHGTYQYESIPGKGTCISCLFPDSYI